MGEFLIKKKSHTSFVWQHVWGVSLGVAAFFGIFFVGMIAYANSYANRVLPGVHIGEFDVGGMGHDELVDFIEAMQDKLVNQGISFVAHMGATSTAFVLYPTVVPNDNILELVLVDAEEEATFFLAYRKQGGLLSRGLAAFATGLTKPNILLQSVGLDRPQLFRELKERLEQFEQPVQNASLVFGPEGVRVVSSSPGFRFAYEAVPGQIISAWSQLSFGEVGIDSALEEPSITKVDVAPLLSRVDQVFDTGSLGVTYIDPQTKYDYVWDLSPTELKMVFEVQKTDNGIGIGLHQESVESFFEDIATEVNVEARNAKFAIGEDGKVEEFRGSRPGIVVDIAATYQALNTAFLQRTWHDEGVANTVALVTEIREPDVKTGEVNDLGITEILGVGYSNFSGSPQNRISNIRLAVEEKLNGLLIKPSSTFSALESLKPFTIEGGYLPELVIKGDKIEPEVGGGLCQIGSTLFRMAMNAGRPITERRNHSLVVSYYNDPRNGKPGTDATLYDNAPDFTFFNDTGKYMMITTEMNVETGDLFFTLWGTSDGKIGSYTEPVVEQWIPAGEKRYIETEELAPGEETCQGKHDGAIASFTYVIVNADGKKEEREFRSHYRALPRICLVGVEPKEEDLSIGNNQERDEQTTSSIF